jgi:two-component system, chemotaxis family, protein-glutamate methylesterase/glutaminase
MTILDPAPMSSARAGARPIRVMIVDDAVVVRGLLSRWLTEAGGIEIASTHRTGSEAVSAIDRVKPDVILLDIEMPDMDGITALPLLLQKRPATTVIVASTLTTRNADISLRCLDLGAMDYIAKPSTNRDVTFGTDFRREIVEKVKMLGGRTVHGYRPRQQGLTAAPSTTSGVRTEAADKRSLPELRPFSRIAPKIIAIGASTGGPHAITGVLRHCRPAVARVPLIITQHMPTMFTAMFADHLRRHLEIDVAEACSGEVVKPGKVYIAPGGKHFRVELKAGAVHAVLDEAPPVNFCRPSVDVTLRSVGEVFGSATLGVILTGMGSDGLIAAAEIVARGGSVIAQDEESSVVWGMPGVIARAGLCAAIGAPGRLAAIINARVGVSP